MTGAWASGGRRRRARFLVITLIGLAIVVVGARRLLGTDDVDPRGLAVLDRPQTAAERTIDVSLVGKLGKGRPRPEDARLVFRDEDQDAILVPFRRAGATNPDRSSLQRFDQVCLAYGGSFAIVSCGNAREILRGALGGASSSETSTPSERREQKPARSHFYGVVPNAVARVEVTFSGRVPSVTGSVSDNFYDVVSTNPEAVNRVGATKWFDADGRAVAH